MTFAGSETARAEIIVDKKLIEQVSTFK